MSTARVSLSHDVWHARLHLAARSSVRGWMCFFSLLARCGLGVFLSWKVLHYFAHYSFASEASNQCYSPTNSLPAEGASAALSIILLTQPFCCADSHQRRSAGSPVNWCGGFQIGLFLARVRAQQILVLESADCGSLSQSFIEIISLDPQPAEPFITFPYIPPRWFGFA